MDCCPMCGCPDAIFIGTLGQYDNLRCRDCGWDYQVETGTADDNDDDGRFATDAEADEDATSPEGEYDGQPDEMQEWHDFDPDC